MTVLQEVGSRSAPPAVQLFASAREAAALEWGDASLKFRVAKAFGSALETSEVEGWLDCSLLHHPFFRVFLGQQQVPVRLVASPRTVAGQTVTGYIDGDKVRDAFAEGATLMLCNMHEWHAPCRALCASLTAELAADVRATAFYSPAGSQGLPTHRDDAHVFVAQLSGRKQWSVFDQPSDPRGRRVGSVDEAECGQQQAVMLEPGDGLYVPPFAAHHATAASAGSLHLSIAVREPVGREVLDAVNEMVRPGLQRIELSGDAAARAEQVGQLLAAITERVCGLDPRDVVAAIEKRFVGGKTS